MNAPAALYWYHQQPRTADYRNSSANRTGPYITELDMTGQPGVFKLVKYVPEETVAASVAAEREAILSEIETGIWLDKTTEEVLAEIATAIRARTPATVKESLTAEQRTDGDAAAQLDALRDALRPFVGFSGHFEVSYQQAGGSASLHAKYSMTERQFATACHALKQLIGDQL